jgi:hypothetical protein
MSTSQKRAAATGTQTWSRSGVLTPLLMAAVLLLPLAARAEDAPAATNSKPQSSTEAATPTSTSGPTSTSDSQSQAKPPMQAGVKKVELSLETLRDVGLDLKHVMKAVGSLYDEVTIQPVSLVTQPEIVGPGTIIYIPINTMPAGPPQPARKDRVDLAMNNIRPIVGLLKTNVDEFESGRRQLDLPADVLSELHPQIQRWVGDVNDLATQLDKLNQLTQGPPYSNDEIASITKGMHQDIKELDDTRRKIYKVIRKEGKKIAAERQNSSQ